MLSRRGLPCWGCAPSPQSMSHPERLKKFPKLGGQGAAAPLNPAEEAFRALRKFGMTHSTPMRQTNFDGALWGAAHKPMSPVMQ